MSVLLCILLKFTIMKIILFFCVYYSACFIMVWFNSRNLFVIHFVCFFFFYFLITLIFVWLFEDNNYYLYFVIKMAIKKKCDWLMINVQKAMCTQMSNLNSIVIVFESNTFHNDHSKRWTLDNYWISASNINGDSFRDCELLFNVL